MGFRLRTTRTYRRGVAALSLGLATSSLPASAYAQEAEDATAEEIAAEQETPAFGVLLAPLPLALGAAFGILTIQPEFQIRLGDYIGLDVAPAFAYYFSDHYFGQNADAMGGGGSLGARIAPMGTGLEGFYIVPRLAVAHAQASSGSSSASNTSLAPTAEFGYAWAYGGPVFFIMNAGGGAGYAFTVAGDDIWEDSELKGLQLILNFSLGIGF